MGRIWVLDTETKGTGAQMVPLDKVLKRPTAAEEPFSVPPRARPPEPKPPAPRPPRRFRIVDVETRALLADDATARDAVAALAGVRSIVDANVFVWQPDDERWRLLTLGEQRLLWDRRPRGS